MNIPLVKDELCSLVLEVLLSSSVPEAQLCDGMLPWPQFTCDEQQQYKSLVSEEKLNVRLSSTAGLEGE